ncbi:MAG: AAA domain-containing protein [Deltaproteobacteria bacterium]|nr:AAA domain-containing protein [Deltaproteobacteria bacterium]
MSTLDEHLARLRGAWHAEHEASKQQYAQERRDTSLSDRVEQGIALKDLMLDETQPAPGDRTLAWFRVSSRLALRDLRLGPGDPVILWRTSVEDPDALRAVIARKSPDRIAAMLECEPPDWLSDPGVKMDRDAPEVTFRRGRDALDAIAELPQRSEERGRIERIFAAQPPLIVRTEPTTKTVAYFDPMLEVDQQRAVQRALREELTLVLGPPGTGKTRTLAEIVRQCVARDERVLITAASHTAVDNLAERLIANGVEVVRIGHPARVSAEMEAHTLDALVEQDESVQLATGWVREAEAIRHRMVQRQKRGALSREDRAAMGAEIRGLFGSARDAKRRAQQAILADARVIASTAAGADVRVLENMRFDRVVLDEATQAPDPIALVALLRAPAVVLAGDPHQLPPTVVGDEAIAMGLATTLFERLAASEHGQAAVTLLRVQHRMHEALMAFPNAQTYKGQLIAADDVAKALLTDLDGIGEDPERVGPLVLLDTVGRGWDEMVVGDDPSKQNPGNAERVANEVRRLLSRGVAPTDIGVITPYNAQVRLLRDALSDLLERGLEVSTVDGFQGREKLVIVVDTVRSNEDGDLGFLRDVRRMNVAITRARRWLLVVGDGALLARHSYYAALLAHAEHTDQWMSAWTDEAEPLP